jgi:hypothetical protein
MANRKQGVLLQLRVDEYQTSPPGSREPAIAWAAESPLRGHPGDLYTHSHRNSMCVSYNSLMDSTSGAIIAPIGAVSSSSRILVKEVVDLEDGGERAAFS